MLIPRWIGVGLALLAVACGAPGRSAEAPRSSPRPARGHETGELERDSASPIPPWPELGGCSYHVDRSQVDVEPEGDTAFTVGAGPLRLHPRDGEEERSLIARVDGPLRFEGTEPATAMALARPVSLEGFGTLPAGLRLWTVGRRGETVDVRVRVTWRAAPRPFTQRQAGSTARITLPRQACDSIAYYSQVESPESRDVAGEIVYGPEEVTLHAEPGSDTTLHVEGTTAVGLVLREERDEWARVELPSSFGASIAGWVRRAELGRTPPPSRPENFAYGGLAPASEEPGRTGTARLRVGAPVLAAPSGAPWAVIGADASFEVRELEPDAPWILIEAAPNAEVVGWRGNDGRRSQRAWVSRADVLELALR